MPLETATYISQLDKSWPLGGDSVNKGDDHVRLLKSVLQDQFPGVDGQGFKKAITATEDEINALVGVSSNIQDQLDDHETRITANEGAVDDLQGVLSAPAGTRMAFHQPSAPPGWTQDVSLQDFMLRVVSGSGGGSGGSVSPITMIHNHATQGLALTVANMPAHTHTIASDSSTLGSEIAASTNGSGNTTQVATNSSGSGSVHNHGNTYNNSVPVKYVNMILCVKD